MSFVAVAIGTVAAVSIYSADQQRKAVNKQKDALLASQAADKVQAAETASAQQTAAAEQIAATKKRRKAGSLLATGADDTLGGSGSVLSRGAQAQPAATTALGAGAPSARATRPSNGMT